ALAPDAAATSRRWVHSISTGGTAINSGPGKSPRLPTPDSAMASSAAMSAIRSESSGADSGAAGTKSTQPAKRVFMPSVAKRLIVLMPDLPAVRYFQLSALPAPSEVTTPIPVTTTIGRPALSWLDGIAILPSGRFDQRQTFTTPVTDGRDHRLLKRS